MQGSHCIALIDNHSQPLVQNLFEDYEVIEARLNELDEQEKEDSENSGRNNEQRILPEEQDKT